MDESSKMPLLIFQPEKYTNIPEAIRKNNAMFQKFKSVWRFFTDGKPKGQPIGAALREKEEELRRYHLASESITRL